MTIDSIQRRIESCQRDIKSLQNRLTKKSNEEASKNSRIAQIKRSITKNTSPSILINKERQIQRLETEIARIQKEKANLTKKMLIRHLSSTDISKIGIKNKNASKRN